MHTLLQRHLTKRLATSLAIPFLISLTSVAEAAVKIGTISNASNISTTAGLTIYGGAAGTVVGTPGATSFANTCLTGGRLDACNERRIHKDLVLSITFTAEKDGVPRLVVKEDNGETAVPNVSGSSTSVAKGTQITLSVRWQDICTSMTANDQFDVSSTCDVIVAGGTDKTFGYVTNTFKVGVSGGNLDQKLDSADDDAAEFQMVITNSMNPNGVGNSADVGECTDDIYGLCHWEVGPGDGKVILKNLQGRNGFPAISGGSGLVFEKIRVYWIEAPTVGTNYFTQIRSSTPDHADVTISNAEGNEVTVTPTRIEGLRNDTRYAFKIALVDPAGNIGYFTADSADDYCDFATQTTDCHIAIPGEVVGALSEEMQCFIATAAYGSIMAPQVNTFRAFRDRFLKPTSWGAKFVSFYYKHSPHYARIISQSSVLRASSRIVLWPILTYAWLSLHTGPLPAAMIFMAALTAIVFSIREIFRRLTPHRGARA